MNKIESNKLRKDVACVCDYLSHDEEKHYEESNRPKNHIWLRVKRLRSWLKNSK